ncbi:MAG: site-specific integrase [Betaproteobacteria bacterium]|nr:site-specific integrase [Betaproteobacteria bacterium]
MPRPKVKAPALTYHISGQSIVRIDGKDYYLGKHDSPESLARYAVLVKIYQEHELSLPHDFELSMVDAQIAPLLGLVAASHQERQPNLVKHVTAAYRQHCEKYYIDDAEARRKANRVSVDVENVAGMARATEFGPVLLGKVREGWIAEGLSRTYINSLTNLVIRMFKWAVRAELIESDVHLRLRTIEPLRRGHTTAKENSPVRAVNIEHVRATFEHLSPVLKAMLRVHLATGMRPSELCSMRPCDIDRSGETWLYTPQRHKCSNRGKERVIPLVNDARDAIVDYLNRDPESYLFSPKESVAWLKAQKRAARKSKVQPSQIDRSKSDPRVTPGICYDKDSYRRALQRAAKKAKVPCWTPYEIRHLVGTVVAETHNLELVKALLGHSDIATTQRYAKATVRQAIQAAKAAPVLKIDD